MNEKQTAAERRRERRLHRKQERKQLGWMTFMISVAIFCGLLLAIGIASVIVAVLVFTGVIGDSEDAMHPVYIIPIMAGCSLIIGSGLLVLLNKVPLRPFKTLVALTNRLAAGDYSVRMEPQGSVYNYAGFKEVSDSFNKLAEELQNTEMLRSDFVNNFSHEFKTPIVSIAGFAKLLRQGELSDAEREQYLAAIEEESMRLAEMATNVLYLTKVENQSILTGKTAFNLSEQIRSAILLLESKWGKRDLNFELNFAEYTVTANEELLRQVWINLLDNAIKFTPEGGTITVNVQQRGEKTEVSVKNTGSEISPDQQQKIFRKFYQADESHSAQGLWNRWSDAGTHNLRGQDADDFPGFRRSWNV